MVFFYLRPGDLAVYLGFGLLDIGITDRDLLLDSAAAVEHCHGVSSPVCCSCGDEHAVALIELAEPESPSESHDRFPCSSACACRSMSCNTLTAS